MAASLLVSGCTSIGPASVTRDRFAYNDEVARSWKEQTLLNIVKSRYLDPPVFLDVSQIVSGYTLQGSVTLSGATIGNNPSNDAGVATLGTQGSWTDRPTITYTPVTGAQFNRNMMTPVTPAMVLFTMEAGWPADLVFKLVVRSINGIDAGSARDRYDRIATLLRSLQIGQALSMRVEGEAEGQQALVMLFRNNANTPEQNAAIEELRGLLSLPSGRNQFTVTFGSVQAREGEIAMLTRSMLQILMSQGAYVEVPEADLRDSRVPPGMAVTGDGVGRMQIRYSRDRPGDAMVAVSYRGGWYWISDRDIETKRTFGLTMLFSTLTETGAREALPLVTIQAS